MAITERRDELCSRACADTGQHLARRRCILRFVAVAVA